MKVGQLYNLDSFKDMPDQVSSAISKIKFGDSYNGTVLARNLTQVDPTVFEKKYPDLVFMNMGIDADNSGGYANRIQSLRTKDNGEFAFGKNETTNKGKISLSGEDNDILVYQKEAFAEWSKTDVEQAALQNYSLTGRLMATIDKVYKREIDSIGLTGIGTNAGLLNNTVFTSTAAGGTIQTRTAQQMYDEISGLIIAQWNGVGNTQEYMADTVIMPIDVMNTIKQTMLNTASSPASVFLALQANFPGINWLSSFRAETGGVGAASATVAIKASSEVMKFRLPVPLQIGEIVSKGSFHWKADAFYRTAGLDILESTGGRILTGL